MNCYRKAELKAESAKRKTIKARVYYAGINGLEIREIPVNELSAKDKFIIREAELLAGFDESRLFRKLGY